MIQNSELAQFMLSLVYPEVLEGKYLSTRSRFVVDPLTKRKKLVRFHKAKRLKELERKKGSTYCEEEETKKYPEY